MLSEAPFILHPDTEVLTTIASDPSSPGLMVYTRQNVYCSRAGLSVIDVPLTPAQMRRIARWFARLAQEVENEQNL